MADRSGFRHSRRVGETLQPGGTTSASDSARRSAARTADDKVPWRFRRGLRGTVRQVQVREGSGRGFSARPEDYLSFRLEVTDGRGDVVEEVPVELSAPEISGRVLRDGDRVIVLGRRTRRGLVKPKGVWVIGSRLEIRGGGGRQYGFFANILALPLGLAFAAAWPVLIYGVWVGQPELILLSVLTMVAYWAIYIRR